MSTPPKYVLVTAAKNEAKHIEFTLSSVPKQTILPEVWIIVDDGSTDATASIVKEYQKKHSFIHLIENPPREKRDFAGKARAIKQALLLIESLGVSFDYIGNLDGDASFDENFYEKLISSMESDKQLGITGGLYYELNGDKWEIAHSNPEWSVGGATQFFRADIFLKMGGYPLLEYGGEDTVLEYLARESGFKVTALKGVIFHHHKPRTFSGDTKLSGYFKLGMQEYMWGTSPIFEVVKCIIRTKTKPVIIGSAARFIGFVYAKATLKHPSLLPGQVVAVRKQQHARLLKDVCSVLRFFAR